MTLLGGRYAPITDAIGFLEANFPQAVDADQGGDLYRYTQRGELDE